MNLQKIYNATDVHVAGEVFRIIDDLPLVQYQSLKELDQRLPDVFSEEIALLLNEPRGFAGINGCLVIPTLNRNADAAAVFFTHEGTVPVHYGGIVSVVTALLENGRMKEKQSGEYLIETVHGLIPAVAVKEKEQVVSVKLVLEECSMAKAVVPLSDVSYSVVQSDKRYALFHQKDVKIQLELDDLSDLNEWGHKTLQALRADSEIQGVILVDDASLDQGRIKTVTFRKDGWIVRSPGFGPTAACFESLLSKGDMKPDEILKNESLFGSFLEARVQQEHGKFRFCMGARGFVTGLQTFVLDPTDPLPGGFLIK